MTITRAITREKTAISPLLAAAVAAAAKLITSTIGYLRVTLARRFVPLLAAGPSRASCLSTAPGPIARDGTRLYSRLQHDGYTVYVPPNPLLGLRYDPAFLRDFLNTLSGPVILVGHSYGGAVITNAATGDPNVKALVYVDAFAPGQGQTIGSARHSPSPVHACCPRRT